MSKLLDDLQAYGVDLAETMDRFVDDEELYVSCLEEFRTEPSFDHLRSALDNGDMEAAFDAAHTLKGVTGNLGFTPLFNAVCPMVETLRSGANEGLEEKYNAIMAEKARVDAILEEIH